jgi:predicted ABC-type ATPase
LRKPTLIVVCGPNGAGKTSITHKILNHKWIENSIYINPDEIANNLFGDWNSLDAIIKAANYSKDLREKCIEEGSSFIFETVLSAEDKIDFLYMAKQKGFFIRVFFVGTESPTINAARIVQRVIGGGHDVPIIKIISRYSKSIANCSVISKFVDRLYVYDNSLDFKEPSLLFRASDGKLTKEYHKIKDWAFPIFNQVNNLK